MNKKSLRFIVLVVAAIAGLWFNRNQVAEPTPKSGGATKAPTIESLYRDHQSDVVVEVSGRVKKILRDDDDGSRHQKFILELAGGHTVLVAHNISLAPRVPIKEGDQVEIRGEYEWSDQGGVLHWTHHDPGGRRPGGWIRHQDREYR